MPEPDALRRENAALRERQTRLSEAALRIAGEFALDSVLGELLGHARKLTGAGAAVVATLDDFGQPSDVLTSGDTEPQRERFAKLLANPEIASHLSALREPLRVADLSSYLASAGRAEPAGPLESRVSMLSVPFGPAEHRLGVLLVADKDGATGFTAADEETVVLFASQAAVAIATERRLRDEQRARADLEALINTAPVGVFVLDARTGRVVSQNREGRRIMNGLRAQEQPPDELREVITLQRAGRSEVPLNEYPLLQVLGSGEEVRGEEFVLRASEGRSVTVIVNATPIVSAMGSVETVVVTFQDMAALEDLARMRAEFLAMVSHELRAPLSSIKGSVTTLLASGPTRQPAVATQFHRIIDDQADRMEALITDLLDVARIEAGALSVEPAPADVTELVDEARSYFLSGAVANALEIDLPVDLPMVLADRQRIVQVLINLLSNAARHSPPTGTIRIEAVARGVQVEISVADQGEGIAAELLPRLFRKFSSRGSRDGEAQPDSGLGLAISRGIVEAHGGRIWAASEGPGRGARFSFTLPATEAPGSAAALTTPRPEPRPTGTCGARVRILAVEDDPQMLRYLRHTLSQAGFEPILTGEPGAVRRLIAERRPHLVLLDLMLPETDGIELMSELPELAELPVIFLSAFGGDRRITRALNTGADDYIVKPFSPTELVARIQTVLRRATASASAEPPEPFFFADLEVRYAERRVLLRGRPLRLTDLEYRMLFELSVNAGRVLTHAELLQRVWGPAHSGRSGAVRSVVRHLRRKLGDDAEHPRYIFNEPRVGYRMPKGAVGRNGATSSLLADA
ncbi:MAG: ATP-binding protein [Chloroflexota bacterium]|nr:ATP-binding protein [Chloroflexota bacterium]MDE2895772.1 ATP-binding protein [Chloroflexota bacterium]